MDTAYNVVQDAFIDLKRLINIQYVSRKFRDKYPEAKGNQYSIGQVDQGKQNNPKKDDNGNHDAYV
jgi:hypothetical protein